MDYFRIGEIVRPHGVKGALKLKPMTDDVVRFQKLNEAFLEKDGEYIPVRAAHISVQPDAVFLSVSCCESREEAEKLRGTFICVDRAHAAELPPDRWYIRDIIGCEVSDSEGVCYGRVSDVMETGANDVYCIQGDKTLMIPALKKLLLEVDVENKHILLDAAVLKEVGLFED